MPLTVITTPGASDANSYCSRAEATTYHEAHLYGSVWTSASDVNKDAALVWATRLLDEQIEWSGYAKSNEQALRWPRDGVLDRDGRFYFANTIIPPFLKNATAELARHLLAGDRTQERSIGIQEVTADTVSVTFDKHDEKPFLPPSVASMVAPYGTIKGHTGGTAKLVRV